MKKVTIYSTPMCVYCHTAKNFLNDKKIKFEEFNVATNLEKRKEMVDKSGQLGVPVIVVGDEIIVGFDEERISELLNIK